MTKSITWRTASKSQKELIKNTLGGFENDIFHDIDNKGLLKDDFIRAFDRSPKPSEPGE